MNEKFPLKLTVRLTLLLSYLRGALFRFKFKGGEIIA